VIGSNAAIIWWQRSASRRSARACRGPIPWPAPAGSAPGAWPAGCSRGSGRTVPPCWPSVASGGSRCGTPAPRRSQSRPGRRPAGRHPCIDRHGQQLLSLQHIALPLGDKQEIPGHAAMFVRVNADFLAGGGVGPAAEEQAHAVEIVDDHRQVAGQRRCVAAGLRHQLAEPTGGLVPVTDGPFEPRGLLRAAPGRVRVRLVGQCRRPPLFRVHPWPAGPGQPPPGPLSGITGSRPGTGVSGPMTPGLPRRPAGPDPGRGLRQRPPDRPGAAGRPGGKEPTRSKPWRETRWPR